MWSFALALLAPAVPLIPQPGVTLNLAGPGFESQQALKTIQDASNARLREQQDVLARQQAEQAATAGRQALRSQVGGLAATGQCVQARNSALSHGEIGMAGEVTSSCR